MPRTPGRLTVPTSRRTFDLVVAFLGVTLVLCVAGTIGLAVAGVPLAEQPPLIGQIATGALAGIAGLLARTPTDGPVRVVQDAGQGD